MKAADKTTDLYWTLGNENESTRVCLPLMFYNMVFRSPIFHFRSPLRRIMVLPLKSGLSTKTSAGCLVPPQLRVINLHIFCTCISLRNIPAE